MRHIWGETYSGHGSVPRRISALLHGARCNLGEWYLVHSSCALLGRFAIGAWISLLWQHSGEREMSASACSHSMPGCFCCRSLVNAGGSADRRLHGYVILSVCSSELCIVLDILSQGQSSRVGEIFPNIQIAAACQTSWVEHQVG